MNCLSITWFRQRSVVSGRGPRRVSHLSLKAARVSHPFCLFHSTYIRQVTLINVSSYIPLKNLSTDRLIRRRLVVIIKVRTKPLLGLLHVEALALSVVAHLILADLPNSEVGTVRVREDEGGHGRGGDHGPRLREVDAGELFRLDELPHCELFRVVRLRRVSRGGTNAVVLDLEQIRGVHFF